MMVSPSGSAAERYLDRKLLGSNNTRRAYTADLRSFEAYCMKHGQKPYPASLATLKDYAVHPMPALAQHDLQPTCAVALFMVPKSLD